MDVNSFEGNRFLCDFQLTQNHRNVKGDMMIFLLKAKVKITVILIEGYN